jgi:hypothetical protein
MAYRHIIELAPERFHGVLESYYSCSTRQSAVAWKSAVVDKVIEEADVLEETNALGQRRAICPLCRGEAQSFYGERGYAFPEGLRRHLVAYGRTFPCFVIQAATELARDYWEREFSEAGPKLRAPGNKLPEEDRRKTDLVFILGPHDSPVLIDERLFGASPRPIDGTDFSVKWAEQRLFALGFQFDVKDRNRAYTKAVKVPQGEFVIYADPRQIGEITFRVFEADVARGMKEGLLLKTFKIRDMWKNSLPDKIAAGVEEAANSSRR